MDMRNVHIGSVLVQKRVVKLCDILIQSAIQSEESTINKN